MWSQCCQSVVVDHQELAGFLQGTGSHGGSPVEVLLFFFVGRGNGERGGLESWQRSVCLRGASLKSVSVSLIYNGGGLPWAAGWIAIICYILDVKKVPKLYLKGGKQGKSVLCLFAYETGMMWSSQCYSTAAGRDLLLGDSSASRKAVSCWPGTLLEGCEQFLGIKLLAGFF